MNELRIEASVENLDAVNAFAEEQLGHAGCAAKASMQLMLALEELFVNIAHYAYGGRPGAVVVQFLQEDGMVLLRLVDEGLPFDPLAKPDPDVTLAAEERSIGGLGIFMVKKTMDLFTYSRTDGKNVVTFGKKL